MNPDRRSLPRDDDVPQAVLEGIANTTVLFAPVEVCERLFGLLSASASALGWEPRVHQNRLVHRDGRRIALFSNHQGKRTFESCLALVRRVARNHDALVYARDPVGSWLALPYDIWARRQVVVPALTDWARLAPAALD